MTFTLPPYHSECYAIFGHGHIPPISDSIRHGETNATNSDKQLEFSCHFKRVSSDWAASGCNAGNGNSLASMENRHSILSDLFDNQKHLYYSNYVIYANTFSFSGKQHPPNPPSMCAMFKFQFSQRLQHLYYAFDQKVGRHGPTAATASRLLNRVSQWHGHGFPLHRY